MVWRDSRSYRAGGKLIEQNDGALTRLQKRRFGFAHMTKLACRRQVGHHQREGFGLAVFVLAQALYGLSVEGITGQVIAAQAFDSQDCTCREPPGCKRDEFSISCGIVWWLFSRPVLQGDMGAADGTGVGLSVEAPVERVAVFSLAVGAHGKDAHCRLIAVIGNIQHDGEAWAAVSAVDERIAITSVGWGEEFA